MSLDFTLDFTRTKRGQPRHLKFGNMPIVTPLDSQSVSDFTVPPRAHPSNGAYEICVAT